MDILSIVKWLIIIQLEIINSSEAVSDRILGKDKPSTEHILSSINKAVCPGDDLYIRVLSSKICFGYQESPGVSTNSNCYVLTSEY